MTVVPGVATPPETVAVSTVIAPPARDGDGVHAIEIDERDAEDAERAIVQRGLAVGDAVVGGEGVAVERALKPNLLPHAGVARVGLAEEERVAEEERGEVDRAARRVGDRGALEDGVGVSAVLVARVGDLATASVTAVAAGNHCSGDV